MLWPPQEAGNDARVPLRKWGRRRGQSQEGRQGVTPGSLAPAAVQAPQLRSVLRCEKLSGRTAYWLIS